MSYLKQEFIDYMYQNRNMQPGGYCNGLDNIEKYFTVGIDAEFDKDQCQSLYDRIQQTRKNPEIIGKNEHTVRQYASNLKRYIEFRKWRVEDKVCNLTPLEQKIKYVIASYKTNFAQTDKYERYKWKAIGWYQQHWNIDTDDFASMLKDAFSKMSNLLTAGMYYAYKMLTDYAEADPEAVRSLFKMLYDESIPLAERYTIFRDSFATRYKPLKLNHYQDLHAVSVYLSSEYEENIE